MASGSRWNSLELKFALGVSHVVQVSTEHAQCSGNSFVSSLQGCKQLLSHEDYADRKKCCPEDILSNLLILLSVSMYTQ